MTRRTTKQGSSSTIRRSVRHKQSNLDEPNYDYIPPMPALPEVPSPPANNSTLPRQKNKLRAVSKDKGAALLHTKKKSYLERASRSGNSSGTNKMTTTTTDNNVLDSVTGRSNSANDYDNVNHQSMIAPRSPADSSEEEHLSSSSTTSEEEEHREDDEEHDEVASQSSGSSNAQDNQAELARAWAIQRSLYNQNKGFEVCDDMVHSIKRIMKEKIFPKLKILSNTEQQYQCPDFVGKPVDQSRIICEIILREIDLEDADNLVFKVRFWITYRSLVKNQLVKYRSNCVEDLKREYFKVRELLLSSQDQLDDKTRAYLEGAQDLINIVTDAGRANNSLIISLREEQHKKAFFFFAREFLPCVVKRLFFRQNKLENLLSEFVTVSDEAFTLFLLENNVARWDAMFQSGTTKGNDSMPQQKYQAVNSGDEKNGKDGYGLQAILRFNEYYRSVAKGRSRMDTTVLERELLKNMEKLENGDGKINKKKRNKRKRDAELNIVDEDGKPLEVLCDL